MKIWIERLSNWAFYGGLNIVYMQQLHFQQVWCCDIYITMSKILLLLFNIWTLYILKGKINAYFDFQNVGFIITKKSVLIPAIYTYWHWRLNFSTNFFNFCWRIPLAMTSLTRKGVRRLYLKETRARKQISFEENGSEYKILFLRLND